MGTVAGSVVQARSIGNVTIGALPQVPRSGYLEQVRRIAPESLYDRESELAELAEFSTASDSPGRMPYLWWRAGAWAGKSALLAWFVLHPPAGVRVVSFFVTARYPGQSDRVAFTDVLMEQLAELLNQPAPAYLTDATRDAHLLAMLAEAASACAGRGERLVLVVDGLDEDSGVTAGPDMYSIAALLPQEPQGGMRIVVAGRPNPPLPDDVPTSHPLRDPGIIRPLASSPHAREQERRSRRELQRLQHGTQLEQDLLGLLVAAGGGLSVGDLEELTGRPYGEVDGILQTAPGRTFTSRASEYAPERYPETYLLGHEELQASARRYFGRHLEVYLERLHGWADGYRSRKWPEETPEYLLANYFSLLVDHGNLPRMTTYAGDLNRQDWMRGTTGGDTAALTQLRTTLDLIAAQDVPDVTDAIVLSCARDLLASRNSNVPPELPAVWAALGQPHRAVALACSGADAPKALKLVTEALTAANELRYAEWVALQITAPVTRALALARVAEAFAVGGAHEDAARVATLAGESALSGNAWMTLDLSDLLAPLIRARADDQVELISRTVCEFATSDSENSHARNLDLRQIAERLVKVALFVPAEQVIRSIADATMRAEQFAWLAVELAAAGRHADAERIATLAEQTSAPSGTGDEAMAASDTRELRRTEKVTSLIRYPGERAVALAMISGALANTNKTERVEDVARLARESDCSWTEPAVGEHYLATIADAFIRIGRLEDAKATARLAGKIARSRSESAGLSQILPKLSRTFARLGQLEEIQHNVQAMVNSDDLGGGFTLQHATSYLILAGQLDEAERIANSIPDGSRRAHALSSVGLAFARVGRVEDARRTATAAEKAANSIVDPHAQASGLTVTASALATAGLSGHAGRCFAAAREAAIASSSDRGWDLFEVEVALALTGRPEHQDSAANHVFLDHEKARSLAFRAEALARSGEPKKAERLASLGMNAESASLRDRQIIDAFMAGTLAQIDRFDDARRLAQSITDPWLAASALTLVAKELIRAGRAQEAGLVAARTLVEASRSPQGLASEDLSTVAGALARAGLIEEAERVAERAASPDPALASVVAQAAEAGNFAAAERIARRIANVVTRACALVTVAGALARTEQHRHAPHAGELTNEAVHMFNDPSTPEWWRSTEFAAALAEAGQFEYAEQIALATRTAGHRRNALVRLTRSLVDMGQLGPAERSASLAAQLVLDHAERATGGPATRSQDDGVGTDQEDLVGVLVVVGQWKKAVQVYKAFGAGTHARALSGAANKLLVDGNVDAARQLIAMACSAGPWTVSVRPTFLIAPSAFEALANVLDTRWGTRLSASRD